MKSSQPTLSFSTAARSLGWPLIAMLGLASTGLLVGRCAAQSVCLPAPRLLTTLPMGGQAGTELTVTITGDYLEDIEELRFSDARLTARPAVGADNQPLPHQFVVGIAADAPPGIYEARVMTRLGVSSSRCFSVGALPEVTRTTDNTSLDSALELSIGSLCNASMSSRAVDHYWIQASEGQRLLIECSAAGIDSKAKPVLIFADAQGRDLVVERRGEVLDYTVPADGKFTIKVHDLTFQGGPHHFYRLAVQAVAADAPVTRMASTQSVSSFSWPPSGLPVEPALSEDAEDSDDSRAQLIELPCDVGGQFFPAADVDTFEFHAEQGEIWWIEVGSERLGLPTDPSVLVQFIDRSEATEKLVDVAELTDIPSPVKPSSNAYAYDGPPYDGGSPDILGKLEIQHTGPHRLRIRDLFGGTRNDPRNVYRLIIRKAAPDFALVAWAFHMELRNGDRAALSKPVALRGGATMALEVAAVRRDGFDGPIDLAMTDLPPGVTGGGLRIAAGQTRGIMLLTAAEDAPRGLTSARFVGRAEIDGAVVERPCPVASMAWPVPDAWQEIPSPRLLDDVPISVSGDERAPLSISSPAAQPLEGTQGQKLTIPLSLTRRCEFSGAAIPMKIFGDGFAHAPPVDVPLTVDATEVTLDLAALKTPPGDYSIALYGNAVAKFSHNPGAVLLAEASHQQATSAAAAASAEATRLAEIAKAASGEEAAAAQQIADEAAEAATRATAMLQAAAARVEEAKNESQPKDIVDIIVSEPIAIRVQPAEAL